MISIEGLLCSIIAIRAYVLTYKSLLIICLRAGFSYRQYCHDKYRKTSSNVNLICIEKCSVDKPQEKPSEIRITCW